ncbi:MAG: Ig-like domain-containing protein [Candidatus Sericytochromatia bacterium]|nr:Ig-like domain-containing protein [Candidatus Sericytochromatia bacterium]
MPQKGPAAGPGPRADVVYCFRHSAIRAEASCSACRRPCCPACLNTAGFCGLCARHNEEARRQAFASPGGTEGARRDAVQRRVAWGLPAALVVVIVAGGGWYLHRLRRPATDGPDPATAALQRLKASEFSPEERAMMARLQRQRRVSLADPGPDAPRRRAPAEPGNHRQARQATLGHAAPAGPVAILQLLPPDGTIVGGQTRIQVVTSGAPTRIVCEVDGVRIGAATGAALSFLWNTRASGNGPHQVTVTASGPGGSSSAAVTLNVMNR